MECPGDSEREEGSLIFVRSPELCIEDRGLVYVSPQASRNWLEQR